MSKKIFVSHCEKDSEIVTFFNDYVLIHGLGFSPIDIFCTSQVGMTIMPDEEWMKSIKKNLEECEIVFFIITPNFKNSEVCQNELGASWALGKDVLLLCIEPISKSKATVLYNIIQVEELNKEDGLDRVRDVINQKYVKDSIGTDRWVPYRKQFITKINKYLEEHPFKELINEEEFQNLKQKYEDLDKAYNVLFDEKEELEEIKLKLIECKDKGAVEKIIEEYTDKTNIVKFKDYIKEISKILRNYHPSIITLIFNTYTGMEFEIDFRAYKNYIQEAIANKIINMDDFNIIFENDRNLVNLEANLDSIKRLISNLSNCEYEIICEDYNIQDLDANKLEFWEKVIDVKLYY